MSTSWLQRKRKGELLELAHQANLPDADGLLKDDLVDALYDHLEANETTYAKQSMFSDFYRRAGSPIKRERSSPSEVFAVTKTRRRATLRGVDSDDPTPEKSALVTRTPRPVSRVAPRMSQVDIPASPSQLAEVADQSFQAAKTKATELWELTRIEQFVEIMREKASSVVFYQFAVLFIEGMSLQWKTLNWDHALTTSALPFIGETKVSLPDMWQLLSSDFWAPTTLWSLTNWTLPLIFSYFFNLTLRSNTRHKSSSKQYTVDPLTFNIARALLAYSAYYVQTQAGAAMAGETNTFHDQMPNWGPFSEPTVRTVRDHVPGGYAGLQIGSVIGIVVSLYDAALKK